MALQMMHDGGGGGYSSPENVSYYQVVQAFESLKTRAENIWTNGEKAHAEHVAKTVADTAWCDKMADFNTQVNGLNDRINNALTACKTELDKFEPHDEVGKTLREHATKWATLATRVQQVHTDVDTHVKVDQWTGEAASEYRDGVLPVQMKALVELKGLAEAQGKAADNAGLTNAWIFLNTRTSIQSVTNAMPASFSPPEVSGKGYTTMVGGVKYDQARYAKHSLALATNLESLRDWLQKVTDPYRADWSGSADQLKTDLETSKGAPKNLQPEGVWPPVKLRTSGDAADTNQMGYSSPYTSGAGSTRDSDDEGGLEMQ